ncbi:hypothetical protein PVAP13_2NG254400 [Panicum virgatum]|uniref:Uncharacterized protein n=1 Tax=Panicum virgatum TaxID=38727 RepID=A0A8T0VN61_PANVG|nr:hypothetical protein PVAP13_2NG254400 [Panicum virgatum]
MGPWCQPEEAEPVRREGEEARGSALSLDSLAANPSAHAGAARGVGEPLRRLCCALGRCSVGQQRGPAAPWVAVGHAACGVGRAAAAPVRRRCGAPGLLLGGLGEGPGALGGRANARGAAAHVRRPCGASRAAGRWATAQLGPPASGRPWHVGADGKEAMGTAHQPCRLIRPGPPSEQGPGGDARRSSSRGRCTRGRPPSEQLPRAASPIGACSRDSMSSRCRGGHGFGDLRPVQAGPQ